MIGSPETGAAPARDRGDLERTAFLAEVGAHLAATLDPQAGLERVARFAVPFLGDWCAIDVLEEDGGIRRAAGVHLDPRRSEDLLALGPLLFCARSDAGGARRGPLEVIRGGPSELRAVAEPAQLAEAASDEGAARIARIGCRSYLCVPLTARGQAVGALTLGNAVSDRRFGAADLGFAEELGRRIALSVDNTRLFRRAQEAHRRAAFLAEAGTQLVEFLDSNQVLDRLARIAVPALADWCAIDLVDPRLIELHRRPGAGAAATVGPPVAAETLPSGAASPRHAPVRVAVCHVDPTKDELVRELGRREAASSDDAAMPKVVRTGEAILYSDLPELGRIPVSGSFDELLRRLGCRSYLCAPLKAHGRVFGALTLVTAESGRRLDRGDLALAEDLARRAALAVENARLYREAQEAVRLREDFLSIASHELRSPLSTMTMAVELLVDDVRTGRLRERDAGYLGMMLDKLARQSRRLDQLIDNLLDATRITQGLLVVQPEDCDLVPLAREVAGRLEPERQRTGSTVELVLPDRGEQVRGRWDRLRIEQVLANLLTNALKFGAGKPVLVSVVARTDGGARVEVRDHGLGIAPQDHRRIFERFERVESSGRPGLGLGLYIVRQIIEAHGGSIAVDSHLGDGARFTVDLPGG